MLIVRATAVAAAAGMVRDAAQSSADVTDSSQRDRHQIGRARRIT